MECITIYEALPNHLVTFPFVIAVALEILLIVFVVVNWKNNSIGTRIGMCIIGVFLFMIIFTIIYNYCSAQFIWNDYKKGQYQIVEGVIEKYEVGTDEKIAFPDRFTVSGKEFIVSNQPAFGYGYSLRQYDGGVLCDGLKCTIYYIPYRFENIIMKIMISKE